MSLPEEIEKLFSRFKPEIKCEKCMYQSTAFGVKICGIRKPAPIEGEECKSFIEVKKHGNR
jgi:hypothetical protein